MIGRHDPTKIDLSKVVVEINDTAVLDIYAAKDLGVDDNGLTHFNLSDFNIYEILSELSSDMRDISLTFPSAKLSTVEIYGLRFYE